LGGFHAFLQHENADKVFRHFEGFDYWRFCIDLSFEGRQFVPSDPCFATLEEEFACDL
jgi:hypothetical protein